VRNPIATLSAGSHKHKHAIAIYLLLLERVGIVVGDPLGTIPGNPIHTSRMVPRWLEVVTRNDVLDLLVV